MRPWLIEVRKPWVIPFDARSELESLAFGLTREEYTDKIWAKRNDAFGPVKKSRKRMWPLDKGPVANIINLKARAKG